MLLAIEGATVTLGSPLVGHWGGDAPRLVAAVAGLVLEIDIRQRVPGVILHDEAGVRFLDGPRRRETGDVIAALPFATR